MFLDGTKALDTPVIQTFWRRRPGAAVPSPSAAQLPRATLLRPSGRASTRSHIMSRRGDAGTVTRAVLPAAGVVQLVEYMIRNQQVRGSSPRAGSNVINKLA